MKLPVAAGALRGLLKELRDEERKPLAVGGAHELGRVLERELARGGDASAVRIGDPTGAAVYVHVTTGLDADAVALRRARRARVPLVEVDAGAAEPLSAVRIAERIAARLGEDGAPLAGRLPVLRGAVSERIVESFARKNGLVGAAVFIPGVDLPVLALNQIRMLWRLDQAFGRELQPLPEVAATIAAGLGLRTVARELLDVVPVAGWAVKGAIAYGGTRALGEAQVRRLRAGASRGAP
jgi:uncharacterized protein (DUF697 family)